MAHSRFILRRFLVMGCTAFFVAAHAGPVVPTYTVVTATPSSSFGLEGVIQPVHEAKVAAQAQGRVVSLGVKAGDRVRAGQVLGTIDDREAQLDGERTRAQMERAQADYQNARAQWERARDLQQRGFVSKAALDAASTQMQSAQAGRDQATASVKLSAVARGYTRVTAPFDGWVQQTHVQTGDLVVPGTPVVTVYAPQPMRVVVQIPHSRVQEAKGASDVYVEMDTQGGGGARFVPSARQIVPSADPVSQTTEWRLELSSKDGASLLPGQPVRVVFTGMQAQAAAVIQVPTEAIVRRGELTGVYVAQGSGFVLRPVRTAPSRNGRTQDVLAGLRVGDVVALDPVKAASGR